MQNVLRNGIIFVVMISSVLSVDALLLKRMMKKSSENTLENGSENNSEKKENLFSFKSTYRSALNA